MSLSFVVIIFNYCNKNKHVELEQHDRITKEFIFAIKRKKKILIND